MFFPVSKKLFSIRFCLSILLAKFTTNCLQFVFKCYKSAQPLVRYFFQQKKMSYFSNISFRIFRPAHEILVLITYL